MMKNSVKVKGSTIGVFTFAFVLCALLFFLAGCKSYAQPGETQAEGHRRHLRNLALNRQGMMADIDTLLLFDEPSKLGRERIQ